VSLQAYYTIAGRDLEREIVPLLQSEGVGLMVWSPLAGGLLSGKYTRDGKGAEGDRRTSFDFPPVDKDRGWAVIDAMRPIAERHGVSVAQIALAWLLSRKVVTSIIVGAKRPEQLEDNIAATRLTLSDDDKAALDEVSKLPSEYPQWMFDMQGARRVPQAKE
jgi:aryl-alcohol dehydrogenase-like predicted oxidoreductase